MKKINALFIVFAIILTACSKDKGDLTTPEPDTSASIVGTWDSQPVNYSGPFSALVFGTTSVQGNVVGQSSNENYSITFSEDPNLVSSVGTFSFDMVATATSPSGLPAYPLSVVDFEFPMNGSWTRSGNQLEIVNGGELIVATIIEVSSSSLKLSFSPEDFNIQESLSSAIVTNVILTNNIVISFTRVAI